METNGVKITLDNSQTIDLSLTKKQIENAVRRAIKKVARWLITESKKRTGQSLGVAQKSLANRFRMKYQVRDNFVEIWVGLLPLKAELIGTPQQKGSGVTAGTHYFKGAFYKKVFGENRAVWRRASSKWETKKEGTGRFPLFKQTLKMDKAAIGAIQAMESLINQRFKKIVNQEINFEHIKQAE